MNEINFLNGIKAICDSLGIPPVILVGLTCLILLRYAVNVISKTIELIQQQHMQEAYFTSKLLFIGITGFLKNLILETLRTFSRLLELPRPYPRITFLFKVGMAIQSYSLFVFFLFGGCLLTFAMAANNTQTVWQRCATLVLISVIFLFSRFFFAEGERDRINLRN